MSSLTDILATEPNKPKPWYDPTNPTPTGGGGASGVSINSMLGMGAAPGQAPGLGGYSVNSILGRGQPPGRNRATIGRGTGVGQQLNTPANSAWNPQTDRHVLAGILKRKSALPQMTQQTSIDDLIALLGNVPSTGMWSETPPTNLVRGQYAQPDTSRLLAGMNLPQTQPTVQDYDPLNGPILPGTMAWEDIMPGGGSVAEGSQALVDAKDKYLYDMQLASDAEASLKNPIVEPPVVPETYVNYGGWGGGWGGGGGGGGSAKKWIDWFKSMYWNV